jgi:hypothetical protein
MAIPLVGDYGGRGRRERTTGEGGGRLRQERAVKFYTGEKVKTPAATRTGDGKT